MSCLRLPRSMQAIIVVAVSCAVALGLLGQDRREGRKRAMNDDKKEKQNMAVRAFTWITGSSADNDYVSIGKVAHYFGSISLRVDSDHSMSRGKLGQACFVVLTDTQRDEMLALVKASSEPLAEYNRINRQINRELEKLLHKQQLDEEALLELCRKLQYAEARLGLIQARGFARIHKTLTAAQLEKLRTLRKNTREQQGGGRGRLPREVRRRLKQFSKEQKKEFMNINTRLLVWVTGSERESYFTTTGKVSQHFGFVKVRVGSKGGATRGGVAKKLESLYSAAQLKRFDAAVAAQKPLLTRFLARRLLLVREMRKLLDENETFDGAAYTRLANEMGRLEGKMTLMQAKLYVSMRDKLTTRQQEAMTAMRESFLLQELKDNPNESELDRGKRVFGLCALCHSARKGVDLAGPSLFGVVGSKAASRRPSFPHSNAMKARGKAGLTWDAQTLDRYLADPRKVVPGTNMPFRGLDRSADRKALIAYLKTLK